MRINKGMMKYSRGFSSKRTMSEDIKKIEQLINNKTEIKDIISNVDILLAAAKNTNIKMDNKNYFDKLKKEIRTGAYEFKPTVIIKPGISRKLGIASTKDKIVLEAMRMVLVAVYEKEFLEHGCLRHRVNPHTALNYVRLNFGGIRWFLEGKLNKSFDSFDHKLLIKKINLKIQDQVFLSLLYKCLKVGYIDLSLVNYTKNGINPISSVLNPILTNIYLHYLDLFLEQIKKEFDKGKICNPVPKAQQELSAQSAYYIDRFNYRPVLKTGLPSYKRLSYIRYGDEFLIGIIGSFKDTMEIRLRIKDFLDKNLNLTINLEETKISNALSRRANFLGYEIHMSPRVTPKRLKTGYTTRPLFSVPISYIKDVLQEVGFTKNKREGIYVGKYVNCTDLFILNLFSKIWLGIAQYYSKATNFSALNSIYYILVYSCLLTLVFKHKLLSKKKGVLKYGMPMTVEGFKFPPFRNPTLPKNVALLDVKTFIKSVY